MPMPIQIAHTLARRLAEVRKADVVPYLRPDGKTQVTVRYENDRPVEIAKLLISTQHKPDIDGETLIKPDLWEHVVEPVLHEEYKELFTDKELFESFLVNPTGKFEIGGPAGRRRPHRAQDHRRHLRRRGPPRRRRLLRQGSLKGRPLGRLRGALRGQERGRRRARRSLRGPGRVRDRCRPPGVADGRDLRHRKAHRLGADTAGLRGVRPAPGRDPAATSTCAGRSSRRPPPTATSAATDHDFTWERTDRVDSLREAAGLGPRRKGRGLLRLGYADGSRVGSSSPSPACCAPIRVASSTSLDDLLGLGDAGEDEVVVVAGGGVEVDVADLHHALVDGLRRS